MAKVLLGFLLGLIMTTFAVEKHHDGSITFTKEEVDIITVNWMNLDYAFKESIQRINSLEEELEQVKRNKCI